MFQGSLLASDFLNESICDLAAWKELSVKNVSDAKSKMVKIFEAFPTDSTPNEAQTEDDFIWKVLDVLGWASFLRQQNLSSTGRLEIPDGLLFLSEEMKASANEQTGEFRRYSFGACLVESKRWKRPLDRGTKIKDDKGTPSTQMLRYLSRADTMTDRKLKWGILTNGNLWRLYWQDAKSRANDYFEVDLEAALKADTDHALKVFILLFGRTAFEKRGTEDLTLHDLALDIARRYEARVADSLAKKIFETVFPRLATAIAEKMPDAALEEVRNAGLVVLYRLLFIFYAEDRDLLPVHDTKYDDYGLRMNVRDSIGTRLDDGDTFASSMPAYWDHFSRLCYAIDKGEKSIGVPPYNGGLFNTELHPILEKLRLPDTVMAELIDAMCFEMGSDGTRKYINYRDLSVQQLGSVYERLLEFEVVKEDGVIILRPNIFARKGSGSYYTPQDLVELIIKETVGPLIERAYTAFDDSKADIARQILQLKICDPAMGSGHFLVTLVDYLSDQVITAIAHTDEEGHPSPIVERIESIRDTILKNATDKDWTVSIDQLDDKNIIRRMILKRCIFGVDKNPMAVELAKVALWLHTFTVGAPLSFLDHHLKCGDSLFGMWVYDGVDAAELAGGALLASPLTAKASQAEKIMELVERLPDTEISEVEQSKSLYEDVLEAIQPLNRLLSVMHGLAWMNLKGDDKGIMGAFFGDHFGRMEEILLWGQRPNYDKKNGERFREIWTELNTLIDEERFFHWQVSFPGVWERWKSVKHHGGFDAVIGNPPWDRIKLQEKEWFEERKPEIARLSAAKRTKVIEKLEVENPKLYLDYKKTERRANQALAIVRKKGTVYPWLGRGDTDLYALFVERAQQLTKSDGFYGLLVPSDIATSSTTSLFFKDVATNGRLVALYDFENKGKKFFKDVHASKKFCSLIVSNRIQEKEAKCAFFLHDVEEIYNSKQVFNLSFKDFAKINPNTGTSPIFRSRRDAELTRKIYDHLPILVNGTGKEVKKAWPIKYSRMFDMANDSEKFNTEQELRMKLNAWPIGGEVWENADSRWLPMYQGKCLAMYNHRGAGVAFNEANPRRPFVSIKVSKEELENPDFRQQFYYYVAEKEVLKEYNGKYLLAYIRSTASTNHRTMVSCLAPLSAYGDSIFLYVPDEGHDEDCLVYLQGNFSSVPFDFVTRQKVGGQNLSKYIVEQLPVVPPEAYETTTFGSKTAGEIVREAVLELTYTAHDMAPFARDMAYVDDGGQVKPPFIWNEDRRLFLKAKLDALYFILYGITDSDDLDYIYSTFPIVRRQEEATYGTYKSRDLAKHWINALKAGNPDANIQM